MDTAHLVGRLAAALSPAGIDCVTPLALGWYNNSIPEEIGARIPARGAAGQAALAVLVANSRSIWEPFLEACAADNLVQLDNPLDAYLERHVCSSLAACAPGLRHRIYWSHRRTADLEGSSEHVAFQRMAHHCSLAYLDETSHLCLHPRFGPWFSLRCVIVFDDVAFNEPKPPELRNPLPQATQRYVQMALHTAVHNTSRKFHVSEVDVEAAEAVLAEASIEPLLEEEEEELGAERGGSGHALSNPAEYPSSSAHSTAGSDDDRCCSGGSTPTASSGCSSPRAWPAEEPFPPCTGAAAPRAQLPTAAVRLAAATPSVDVPSAAAGGSTAQPSPLRSPTAAAAGGGAPGSPLVGSAGSTCSQRSRGSSLDTEGRPSMTAVAKNWKLWVAVRDAPCTGHPMRYSQEQIDYHYTRNRAVLFRALLRRNLAPRTPGGLPAATGLLNPSFEAFHAATMQQQQAQAQKHVVHACQAASTAAATAAAAAAAATASPITAA